MSLPTARLALPHVGCTREQGSRVAPCLDAQIDRVFRRGQPDDRQVRPFHDGDLQRGHLPGLPAQTAAAPHAWQAHDRRLGQCPLPPRDPVAALASEVSPPALAPVSATLLAAARTHRESLEAGAAARHPQPILRNPRRGSRCGKPVFQSLVQTQRGTSTSMLHYLSRRV